MYRVSVNPEVMGGLLCIDGTQAPVSFILAALADGFSRKEIREYYTELQDGDIAAALLCGAALAATKGAAALLPKERVVRSGL